MVAPLERSVSETERHRTSYRAAGPDDGPLLFFLHGYPDHSIYWGRQIEYFSDREWRLRNGSWPVPNLRKPEPLLAARLSAKR